jgi:hypothetical protein
MAVTFILALMTSDSQRNYIEVFEKFAPDHFNWNRLLILCAR